MPKALSEALPSDVLTMQIAYATPKLRGRARRLARADSGTRPRNRAVVDGKIQQAAALAPTDPQQALTLAATALTLATALNYAHGVAHSQAILGCCYAQLDNHAAARSALLSAIAAFEHIEEYEPQANALNSLGNLHAALGDHHTAYALYLKSLTLRQHLGLTKAEAASWNNIGNIFYYLADYPQALVAYHHSLDLKKQIGDQDGVAISLHNIGNIYEADAKLDLALHYYQQSLSLARTLGNRASQAGTLGNLGTLYFALGNPQLALTYHLQSLALERELGNRHGEAESLMQLGRLFLLYPTLLHETTAYPPEADPALSYLQQASALATEIQANDILMRSAQILAQLYEQRGDLTQALTAYRQFHALERTIFNKDLSEQTKKLQVIHQVETAMQAAELKRVEAELAHLKNTELQALLAEADHQRSIAEEASRFKTKLLSIAAHDLRNPLSGISGFSNLLLKQTPPNSSLQELALRINQSAQRMEHMLNDLLDSTRIEDGGLTLQIERLNLTLLAHELVASYQQQAQRKAQQLILQADEPLFVQADRDCLSRIIENLLSNAIKFSPFNRPIWVCLSRHGEQVRCAVRDQGPGLTPEDQQKLFGRFQRLSATPTGGERSIGLGLAIVRQLVELHDAHVWAESAGPGQGSTFIVELPLSR